MRHHRDRFLLTSSLGSYFPAPVPALPGFFGQKGQARCDHSSGLLQRCAKAGYQGCRDNRRLEGKK